MLTLVITVSYAPLLKPVRQLLTSLSDLVGEVLKTAYGSFGSSAAQENPETAKEIFNNASGLSRDLGGLFSLLPNLLNLGA